MVQPLRGSPDDPLRGRPTVLHYVLGADSAALLLLLVREGKCSLDLSNYYLAGSSDPLSISKPDPENDMSETKPNASTNRRETAADLSLSQLKVRVIISAMRRDNPHLLDPTDLLERLQDITPAGHQEEEYSDMLEHLEYYLEALGLLT